MTYGSYDRRRRRPRRRDAAGSSFAERVRRARERLQAQRAAQAQLAEVAQRSAPLEPPLITSAPTPEPQRSLLENLRGAFPFLDPVGQARDMAQEVRRGNFLGALTGPATSAIGLMDQATRNVAAPGGSATISLFPTGPTADRSLLGQLRQGLGSGPVSDWRRGVPVGPGTIGAILNRLSGDDLEAEERRRSKSRAALPDFLGRIGKKEGPRWLPGFVSPLESSRVLAEAQVERPMPLQIVSETISPVGIAEAFIPIGKFRSAIKPVSKHLTIGAKRPGVAQRVMELPPSEEIIDMVIPEGGIQRGESWFGRGVGKVVGTVSRNAVAYASDPVTRVETYNQLMPELVRDAANGQVSLVLRNGRANDVFDVAPVRRDPNTRQWVPTEGSLRKRTVDALGRQTGGPKKYRVTLADTGDVVDRAFEEIAQFPEHYALNPTQMKWLDDFDESTRNLMEYARKVGAVEDSLLTENKVKGRYFPNFWKFFDGELMDDLTGVNPSLAVKQDFMKSRFYEEARDAVAIGFNGGDPDEAVAILYKSIYKRIGDKHLENMVRPLGNTIDSRIGDQLLTLRDTIIKRQKGLRTAKGIIGQYSVSTVPIGPGRMITKGPRKGTVVRKSLAGRTAAERAAPELMEAFWKASVMSGPERARAFKALKARASLLEKDATATANSAKDAVAKRRKAARPRQGEVQLPMSGISDVVFTAKEDAKRVFQQFDEWGQKVSGGAKGTTDLSREQLNRLEAVLAPEAQQAWWRGLTSGSAAVSSAARTAMAATDIGAPMIHGLPVLLTKPGVWSEAATAALAIWKDPAVMARYIDAHWDTYQKLLSRNGVHGGGSEYVEAMQQGGILQQLVSKGGQAPVVGPAARGVESYLSSAERNFNGFILISKMLMYEALEPVAIRKGGEAALDQLVSHVGKLTGTVSMASMGTNPTMRELLGGFVLFAPRYRMAIYGLMKDVFDFKNFRGELARESLGKMLTGGLIAYSVIATKAHQKPKLDPRKSDFLTLEIGDSNIGIGSGFVSLAKFTAALLAGGGKDFEFTAKNILGHMADKTGRFVRGQSAPTSSMGWDLVSGRNYIGEPTKGVMPLLKNSIATHITPFWAQGLMDMPRPGWHASVAEFGGMRTFPVSSYERAVDAADIHSQAAYNLNFRELNRLQQETIRRDNPGVQAMFDESSRVWRERGRADEITLYREEQKKVRDIYDEEISKKIALLVTGRIDAKQLRDSVSAAGAYMRLAYSRMEEDHPEAIEALNAERQNPDAHIEDIAYTDYIKTVIAGDFEDPETGIFDYQARARAEAMWREAYGENVWAYVQQRRNLKVESLLQELYQGRTRYRPYYEAGEQILKQMGAEALTRKWHQYVKARGVDKELIELEYPVFKQVQRVQSKVRILMRERNAELDAHMYRWQYADKLRHPANEGRERELLSYE